MHYQEAPKGKTKLVRCTSGSIYDVVIYLRPDSPTLAAIQKRIPLQISEVTRGTEVFDWTVPKEWNFRTPTY